MVLPAQMKVNTMTNLVITSRGLSVELNVTGLTQEIREKAMLHGLKQKVADAAAGAKDTDDGQTAAQNAQVAMQTVVDALVAGSWGRERGASAQYTVWQNAVIAYLMPKVKAKNAANWAKVKVADRKTACLTAYDGLGEVTKGKVDAIVQTLIDAKNTDIELDL